MQIHIILHMRSLIRAFVLHWTILLYPMILFADGEGPDQTARMRSLIWAFAVRICPKIRFRIARPIHLRLAVYCNVYNGYLLILQTSKIVILNGKILFLCAVEKTNLVICILDGSKSIFVTNATWENRGYLVQLWTCLGNTCYLPQYCLMEDLQRNTKSHTCIKI